MNEPTEELASRYILDQLDATDRAAFETRLLREPELATPGARTRSGLRRRHPFAAAAGAARRAARSPRGKNRQTGILPPSASRLPLPTPPLDGARPMGHRRRDRDQSLHSLAVQSLRRPAAPTIVLVGLDANRNTFAELPLGAGAKDADARFIQLASLAQGFWEKPGDLPLKSGTAPATTAATPCSISAASRASSPSNNSPRLPPTSAIISGSLTPSAAGSATQAPSRWPGSTAAFIPSAPSGHQRQIRTAASFRHRRGRRRSEIRPGPAARQGRARAGQLLSRARAAGGRRFPHRR
ncbi:MAG: hypothetical protein WDM96_13275 [Lacunisphaera sp.]